MVTIRSCGRTGQSLGTSPFEFGRPTTLPRRETAAGGQHAHDLAPVVAAGDRVGARNAFLVHPRRAAEFAHHQHDGRIEQAAIIEIFDQAADGRVKPGQNRLHSPLEARMIIPAAEGQRHESHPRLDEPPRQQCTLAPLMPAIPIAQPRVFLADIERVAGRVAQNHAKGLLVEPVQIVECARGLEIDLGPGQKPPARSRRLSSRVRSTPEGSRRLGT